MVASTEQVPEARQGCAIFYDLFSVSYIAVSTLLVRSESPSLVHMQQQEGIL